MTDTLHSLTTRQVPDRVYRALRERAARHGRSMEAEVRAILNDAVEPDFVTSWLHDTEDLRGDPLDITRPTTTRQVDL